jgi:hypothetical protein
LVKIIYKKGHGGGGGQFGKAFTARTEGKFSGDGFTVRI